MRSKSGINDRARKARLGIQVSIMRSVVTTQFILAAQFPGIKNYVAGSRMTTGMVRSVAAW